MGFGVLCSHPTRYLAYARQNWLDGLYGHGHLCRHRYCLWPVYVQQAEEVECVRDLYFSRFNYYDAHYGVLWLGNESIME